MVFVTVGTTHHDFSRLFRELDRLVAGKLLSDVTAQIGNSAYQPIHYKWQRFISAGALQQYLNEAEYIICHAGAGTLNECLGLRKKVIVVPRLFQYREAPDDHQMEIAQYLSGKNRILLVRNIEDLGEKITFIKDWNPSFSQYHEPEQITSTIQGFIKKHFLMTDK